jgi:putative endopeptidase
MPSSVATILVVLVGSCGITSALDAQTDHAKPLYGAWGYDATGADLRTKPGDDFFRYANGTWIGKTQIPPDKSSYSLWSESDDRTEKRLHDLIEATAKSGVHRLTDVQGKIGAFYKAFMNESRVNELGSKPLEPALGEVRRATSRSAVAALMGRNNSDFEGTLFNFSIDADLKDPKRYAVYVSQGGLGLPDRDYYLKKEYAAAKAKYQTYVAKLLELIRWPAPSDGAKAVVEFEARIADASWTKTQQRDPVATYNPMTPGELATFAAGFDWKAFLASAGLTDASRVIVAEKSAFPKLAAIFAATPIETLQAWQAFHIADNAAPYLSTPFAEAHFEMRDKTLSGQMQQTARWKRAVRAVSGGDFLAGDRFGTFGTMGWAVGQLYTAKYFPPQSKGQIEALVANLKAAYRVRLKRLDWMGPKTKGEALNKLDTYTIKVGYPDHPRDYSSLVITEDDLIGDVRRAGAHNWEFLTGRLSGPVDRTDWAMTPQTGDAYNGLLRDIVFPAGILQPPLFDPAADPAVNYGAIGAVIGHELTHGFDDQGRKIDAAGALRDWWTKEDAERFDARAKVLGEQYSKYEPIPGAQVNGDLTMGENIADLGGVALALEAYHASLDGKQAPVIDRMTGDQRVLLAWAQVWRAKQRDDLVRKEVVSDPHSPPEFRTNGVVRNLDDWYTAFDVKPGDSLYVSPGARVRIW